MSRDLDAWIDVQSALLDLPIDPAHRPGVRHYLALVASIAPRVMDFELGPADEPANVFVPVPPPAMPGDDR
ncbi:MAG: DUF4089 domain-containing protein [Rubrivivax sp.]|jgi:hypothetical protein|nr:DUF4089 domain-containing protein [Rubrivivax sp.]